jgi:hypothetical protein
VRVPARARAPAVQATRKLDWRWAAAHPPPRQHADCRGLGGPRYPTTAWRPHTPSRSRARAARASSAQTPRTRSRARPPPTRPRASQAGRRLPTRLRHPAPDLALAPGWLAVWRPAAVSALRRRRAPPAVARRRRQRQRHRPTVPAARLLAPVYAAARAAAPEEVTSSARCVTKTRPASTSPARAWESARATACTTTSFSARGPTRRRGSRQRTTRACRTRAETCSPSATSRSGSRWCARGGVGHGACADARAHRTRRSPRRASRR